MVNKKHLAILKQGVEVWNKWREENPEIRPDLSRANLKRAKLIDVNLRNVTLFSANLNGAELIDADLSGADLKGAKLIDVDLSGAALFAAGFSGADLSGVMLFTADLSGADLSGADLHFANLSHANLSDVNLTEADLTKAIMGSSNIGNVDLSEAKGLNSVKHHSPSTMSIDTIYLSKGNIPIAFLRGAGVPDDMIAYIHSIAGDIQFYSCFISYSSKDQEFAERLHADLQAKGVRCWFAPQNIRRGEKIHEQIDQAIRMYDKLLLILSADSMNSEWVKTEIANARQREIHEKRKMLFPVSLVPYEQVKEWKGFDADTGKDSAREIREYYIPDFSNWEDHKSYTKEFDKLLKDLKAKK
jgi:hypothetical protein